MIDLSAFSGHTPGPWMDHTPTQTRYDMETGYPLGDEPTGPPEILRPPSGAPDDHGDIIATVHGSYADARLIAAAPDLLAEVIRLRALVKSAYEEGWEDAANKADMRMCSEVWPYSGTHDALETP